MKQVREFNFARPRDAWLMVFPHEWDALAGLPAWATRLFMVLLSLSDFKTGNGRTGYGELINALTPDQPERGPRLWAPSRDDVKAMLARFESLLIVARDKLGSEQRLQIIFHVAPRARKAAPAEKLPRKLSPGSTEGETPKLPPQTRPGLSEKNSIPPTPTGRELSTGPAHVVEQLAAVRQRIAARCKTRAPEGA